MVPKLVLSHRAYLSILLHTAKYPHQTVNGVLLASSTTGGEVIVEQAVPLLHHWTSLSPMMEIGIELASTYAADAGLSIVAYYQANPTIHTHGFGPVGDRILTKLRQTAPDTVGFLVHLDELSSKSSAEVPALITNPAAHVTLNNKRSPIRALELIASGLQSTSFADFDDHLENVQLDWLNNAECADQDWSG
ncbi:hypothetical protein FRC18_003064 [Serendipita sp. 400]|nr:hypothetical protein FRC18_003064 [Serendipita sp. 400]